MKELIDPKLIALISGGVNLSTGLVTAYLGLEDKIWVVP